MSKVEPRRNKYVGHRYVPKIFGEWDKTNSYEGLSIVTYEGNSYTSKQHVPVGIDIKNENYWVVTGNYDVQVEHYRQEVRDMKEEVESKASQTDLDLTNDFIREVDEKNKSIIVYVEDFPRIAPENSDDGRIKRALETIQRGTIVFSRGTYEIATSIEIDHDRLQMRGAGLGTILKTVRNIPILKSLSSERTMFKDRSISNLTVSDIYFQGENKTGIGLLGTGIARNSKIFNCYFRDLDYAIVLDGSWSFSLERCFATHCNNGFHLATGLAGQYINTTETNAVNIDTCYLTDIKNNQGTGIAIKLYDRGYQINIHNCTIEQNDSGILLGECRVVSIKNNYIEHNDKFGLQLGDGERRVSNWRVTENHFNFNYFKPVNARYGHYEDNFNPNGTFEVIKDQENINNNTFIFSFTDDITDGTKESGYGVLDSKRNVIFFKQRQPEVKLNLENDWENYEEPKRGGLRVYTTPDGMAHVEGAIVGGLTGFGNRVSLLPLGYRPHYLTYFTCIDESGKAVPVSISNEGVLIVRQHTDDILYISCHYRVNPFSNVLV